MPLYFSPLPNNASGKASNKKASQRKENHIQIALAVSDLDLVGCDCISLDA